MKKKKTYCISFFNEHLLVNSNLSNIPASDLCGMELILKLLGVDYNIEEETKWQSIMYRLHQKSQSLKI